MKRISSGATDDETRHGVELNSPVTRHTLFVRRETSASRLVASAAHCTSSRIFRGHRVSAVPATRREGEQRVTEWCDQR
jgi:hypothetical protein